MRFLYNFSIATFGVLLRLVVPFHQKTKLFVNGRRHMFKNLKQIMAGNKAPVIWVHCASLGEFEQGRPVIEALKQEFKNYKVLLTFFSPSGYEIRKNYEKADYISYLPLDTPSNAKHFIELTRPVLAVFVKYEFWYNYSHELKRRNIPVLSVSCIFRPGQVFFQSYGFFFRKILSNYSYFFTQNDESVKLLKSIDIHNCVRVGDTRFDRVHQIVKQGSEIPIAKTFKGTQKCFVIGSCWPEDLDVLIPFINDNYYQLKFIIAPHEISESFLLEIEGSLQVNAVRYSKADEVTNLEDYQVLLIDNIGMLSRLYRYGEFAYVGGAFGKGLHNILEAACYGLPVFFGNKNYEKFDEATNLIMRGGAFEVSDYRDLKNKYELINIPENFLLACEVTRYYVEENLGATDKIIDYCRKLLQK